MWMYLGPPRPLLEAVSDLVRSLANSQIGLDIAAVPFLLLQLHAQRKVLRHCVLWGHAHLHKGLRPDQEVCT